MKFKVGDLVKIKECLPLGCPCFFCESNSSRIGVVLKQLPSLGDWLQVLFDVGKWNLREYEAEVFARAKDERNI